MVICISVATCLNLSNNKVAIGAEPPKLIEQENPLTYRAETETQSEQEREAPSLQVTEPPVVEETAIITEAAIITKPAETQAAASITENAAINTTAKAKSTAANTTADVTSVEVEPIASKATSVPDEAIPFAWNRGGNYNGLISIREATAPGDKIETAEHAVIDYSNAGEGYVMIKLTGGVTAAVNVIGPGMDACERTYFIKNKNLFYPIPLQYGNGGYYITIVVYCESDLFLSFIEFNITVQLYQSDINYLYPNIFSNYNSSSKVVKKSFDLSMNANNELEKVQSVYGYITENFQYSFSYGSEQYDYIPNLDSILNLRSGACMDIAALMTAMCRAQGIKTKLVFGYTSGKYHAWVEVYIPQSGQIAEGIYSTGGWIRLDPTLALSMSAEQIKNTQYVQCEVY